MAKTKKSRIEGKNQTLNTNIPQESDYLEATDLYLPFSNNIRADQYLKLKRCEYWNRESIREILEKLLDDYFENKEKEASERPLPDKEVVKLKQLKSANDYNKLRVKGSEKS